MVSLYLYQHYSHVSQRTSTLLSPFSSCALRHRVPGWPSEPVVQS